MNIKKKENSQSGSTFKQRKICVITGSRAEYGLLKYLLEAIRKDHFEITIDCNGFSFVS